ncbi:hypothetical protein [Thermococcus sp.]|uniref:hypothetical protein n=1 Tax=Thermococcus sp. TaxID=35749 RepID=UPI00260FA634|nr:hypothetical protein [Thermococcus sp.]
MIEVDIEVNDFKIRASGKGSKSPEDFILRAKFRGKREFTPKHAHFIIDFYGKLCYSTEVRQSLFKLITRIYLGETPEEVLRKLDPVTLKLLNTSPGYPIEYILYALWLLFEIEDINYPQSQGKNGRRQPYQMFVDVMNGMHPVNAMKKAGLRI